MSETTNKTIFYAFAGPFLWNVPIRSGLAKVLGGVLLLAAVAKAVHERGTHARVQLVGPIVGLGVGRSVRSCRSHLVLVVGRTVLADHSQRWADSVQHLRRLFAAIGPERRIVPLLW